MNADEKMDLGDEKSENTNFEYLYAKVQVLQGQVEKIQKVLDEFGLKYVVEENIPIDIEDETFKQLEECD